MSDPKENSDSPKRKGKLPPGGPKARYGGPKRPDNNRGTSRPGTGRYGSSRDGGAPAGGRDGVSGKYGPRSGGGGAAGPRSGKPDGERWGGGAPRSYGSGGSGGGGWKGKPDDGGATFRPRKFSDRKEFPKRDDRGERPAYRPSADRGDRPPRKTWGDKPEGGEKRPYQPRDGGDRKPFAPRDGEKRPFRPREDGERKPYGDRGGDREFKPRGDRGFDRREGAGPRGFKPGFQRDFAPRGGDRGFRPAGEKSFEPRAPLHPEVLKYIPLKDEKGRYRNSRFLIEGAKNIADVAEVSPDVLYTVLVAEGFENPDLLEKLRRQGITLQEVPAQDLAALGDTGTPQGIVAVANFGALRPDWNSANIVTLIDGVQDPGNVGAILRTSAALGMDAVVLGKGTCDAYNPKVVRASAASLLRVPLETDEDLAAKIQFLRLKGFTVVATSPHAQITLSQAKLRRKVALLFGNEGAGVGPNLMDQADITVRIPMRGKVESLNVAVAHGLMTYELLRLQADR